MRIVFTGGGTGGHVFPLIAIIREAGRILPDADMRFIGPLPFGADLLVREGVVVRGIFAGKIPRYLTPKFALEILKIPIGFVQALWELYWFMPDIVFGKGGYGMVPVVIAAWLFRIPAVIHESDSVAGLSTKITARFAKIILISFSNTKGVSGNRVRQVGNPVRSTITQGDYSRAQRRFHLALRPTILVLGGSQGAQQLNDLMLDIGPKLAGDAEIIHQVGQRNTEQFAREMALALEAKPDAVKFYHIVSFLDEAALADAYAAATLVVSRAGAGAIFELALVGLPVIFLPFGGAASNHQYWNAQALAEQGAAIVFAGPNATTQFLLKKMRELLNDAALRNDMSQRIRAFAKPNAAREIAEIILKHGT